MKKILSALVLCVALVSASKAQDLNFSQFFASPLTLNPAFTGKFDGVYRIAGNYRNQWPEIYNAYNTMTASMDFRILKNRISENDQFGVGVLAFSDKAGEGGALQDNYIGFSTAYHVGLDENGYHTIGAGFQGSMVSKRLDITKVHFEDQLTPLGFTGVTSEFFDNSRINISYFDLNAGILYNGSTNGYNNFYVGASMYHLNRPKETFQGGTFLMNPRTSIQAGGQVPAGPYNYIHFSANYSTQANAYSFIGGGAYSLNVNSSQDNPTNVYLGVWTRLSNVEDAVVPYLGLEFGSLRIGYTYDVNISSLKAASNSVGGNEISLIFVKKPTDPNAKKLNCPKF